MLDILELDTCIIKLLTLNDFFSVRMFVLLEKCQTPKIFKGIYYLKVRFYQVWNFIYQI